MLFQAKNSPRNTIETWVHSYSREFYRFAYLRLNKHEDAEDAVQQTFIKAFRYYESYKQGSSEKAWLYTILSNTIKDYLRQTGSRPQSLNLEEEDDLENLLVDASDTPDTALEKKMNYEKLQEGIANLPEHFATPLIMREVSDMSYKEISDYLSVPMGTVMSRLSRARKALFELLTGENLQATTNTKTELQLKEDKGGHQ
jgi:RNA polymerase sigma-70 factor (ECF subfamily)